MKKGRGVDLLDFSRPAKSSNYTEQEIAVPFYISGPEEIVGYWNSKSEWFPNELYKGNIKP